MANCLSQIYNHRAKFGRGSREAFYSFVPAEDAAKAVTARLATVAKRLTRADLHSCWNQPDPFRNLPPKDERCPHPPARLFSWHAGEVLCVGCCECGKVLKGGVE